MIADIRDPTEPKPLPGALVVRELQENDRGFVFANYLKSAHGGYAYRNMLLQVFQAYGSRMLESILQRSQAVVLCDKSNPDALLGFAIAERPFKSIDDIVLHYVYVKYDYRRRGLCSAMIKALGHDAGRTHLFVTHFNVAWFHIGEKYGAAYNPFFLFPEFHTEKKDRK